MIVKLLSRHNASYDSLIGYILKGARAKGKEPQVFTHNLRSEDKKGWVKEYIENEALRQHPRSNQVYLYHEIISFSNKEETGAITKEMLDDIGNQYISLRGKDGVFMGAVHQEKGHTHIHFCTSGVKFRTGMAFRMSRYELQGVKIKLQEYHKQKYPEIKQSFPKHGKGQEYVTDREWQARHKDERAVLKSEISAQVKSCFDVAKSQKEFLELLRDKGLHHYERSGKATGITYEDTKFRFSRMGISNEQFNGLAVDRAEEQKALDEIQAIRDGKEERAMKEKDIDDQDLDMERR